MISSQSDRQIRGVTKTGGLSRSLVTVLAPRSAESEAYRTLRANVSHTLVDDAPPRVVMVTSPGSKENKSVVCANLGVAMAQAGKNTLIVDCDLRKPIMHKVFGLPVGHGLVNVLAGESPLYEVCQEPLPGLKVLTADAAPPNPDELLESQRFSDFLAKVREEFDYVLVDSSPAGLVSDPAILAALADGVLLVLDAQRTRREDVRRTVRNLTTVGAAVLGTVMNNAKGSRHRSY